MEKEEDTARVQQLRDHKFTLCGHRLRRTDLKPGEDELLRPGLMGLQPARPSRRALSRVQPQIQNTQKNNDFFLGGGGGILKCFPRILYAGHFSFSAHNGVKMVVHVTIVVGTVISWVPFSTWEQGQFTALGELSQLLGTCSHE